MNGALRIGRPSADKGRLVSRALGNPSAGVTVHVESSEAAVLTRDGRVVSVLEPGDLTLGAAQLGRSPLVTELWFVSRDPLGALPIAGELHLREQGHARAVPFRATCGVACDHPKLLVEALLAHRSEFRDDVLPALLRELLGALTATVQQLLDKRDVRILDLGQKETARALLDRALVPGRAALGRFGTSFLGFQRGVFGVEPDERSPASGRVAVPPADFSATPYPTSRDDRDPPVSSGPISTQAKNPPKQADFRDTPYPISVPFATSRDQRVVVAAAAGARMSAVPSSPRPLEAPAPSTRVYVQMDAGDWKPGRLLRVEGDLCEVTVDGLNQIAWLPRARVSVA